MYDPQGVGLPHDDLPGSAIGVIAPQPVKRIEAPTPIIETTSYEIRNFSGGRLSFNRVGCVTLNELYAAAMERSRGMGLPARFLSWRDDPEKLSPEIADCILACEIRRVNNVVVHTEDRPRAKGSVQS